MNFSDPGISQSLIQSTDCAPIFQRLRMINAIKKLSLSSKDLREEYNKKIKSPNANVTSHLEQMQNTLLKISILKDYIDKAREGNVSYDDVITTVENLNETLLQLIKNLEGEFPEKIDEKFNNLSDALSDLITQLYIDDAGKIDNEKALQTCLNYVSNKSKALCKETGATSGGKRKSKKKQVKSTGGKKKTSEKVVAYGKERCVYLGSRGGRYVKVKGEYKRV
jgi:hypothetical protein